MDDGNTPAPAGTATDSAPAPTRTQADIVDDIGKAFLASDAEAEEQPKDDEAETPEGETAEEESTAEGDEAEGQEEDKQEAKTPDDGVRVKLDDGNEVTLGELKRGFLRQSDYTRKTQEVAQDRRAISEAAQRLTQADQTLRQQLDLAVTVLQSSLPQPPDPGLINTDAVGYLQQKAAYDQRMAELNRLAQARTEAEQRAQETQSYRFRENVAAEMQALTDKVPEFRSPEKRTAFMTEAADIASRAYGLSGEEIGNIVDHRQVLVLRDAIAYRKLQSEKMRAVAKAKSAPPIRPAVRQAPGTRQVAEQKSAEQRLRQEGSVDAFVELVKRNPKLINL